MAERSRTLMWVGIGLCAAGAVGLLVGGVLNVDAANPWASIAGGAAGLVGLALTLYAVFGGATGTGGSMAPSGSTVTSSGVRSVAAGGSVGTVSTGDGGTVPASPDVPPNGTSGPRNVTASGDRSIAAGGDIGSASTGDV